tara:strand:- start:409 stop:1617 length:1209 start_codon:yes stop_codon:yes gene_type:complete
MEKENLKKNIVIFTPYYYPEPFPINTFVKDLSKNSDVRSIKIITALPNYRKYGFYDGYSFFGPFSNTEKKISITRLLIIPRYSNSSFSILLFYVSFFLSALFYLFYFSIKNRKKYDHILTFCGSPVYVGYLGIFASKLMKIESSQWVQDIWPEAIQTTKGLKNKKIINTINFLQNQMWKYSDILFSESYLLTKYLKSKFPHKKIKTLYNPVRKKEVSNCISNRKTKNKLMFSYTGNIGGAQNLDKILEAFSDLNQDKFELHMCGDGPLVNEFKIKFNQKNIFWHGWLTGKDLDDIYVNSDFFILSLNSEGRQSLILPSKLQTYFQLKRPIFCVARGAVKELIDFTSSGITTCNDDKKNIVELFNKALNLNARDRIKMADNGFKYYKENFRSETIIREFLNFI